MRQWSHANPTEPSCFHELMPLTIKLIMIFLLFPSCVQSAFQFTCHLLFHHVDMQTLARYTSVVLNSLRHDDIYNISPFLKVEALALNI